MPTRRKIYGMKAGCGRKSARIGIQGDDVEKIRADMTAFWRKNLA